MRSFALASGSSGNSYYIESNQGVKVLVDLGISFAKTKQLLDERGVNIKEIDAIFITHEHSDHIAGLSTFTKQLDIPFYLSRGTQSKLKDEANWEYLSHHDTVELNDLKVFVLEKPHDAEEALHFVFDDGKRLGVFTDFGHVTDEVKHVLKTLDIVYFEANYCDEKLRDLKGTHNINYLHRLASDTGHLSLQQSTEALMEASHDDQTIILSHISENTNTYEHAYVTIKESLSSIGKFPRLLVSFQGEPTEWFE